jgi:hypothetical protein
MAGKGSVKQEKACRLPILLRFVIQHSIQKTDRRCQAEKASPDDEMSLTIGVRFET